MYQKFISIIYIISVILFFHIHHIYIYIHIYVWMYPYIYIDIDICMYIYVYICMYVCMHACMYVCMYVCVYIYIYISYPLYIKFPFKRSPGGASYLRRRRWRPAGCARRRRCCAPSPCPSPWRPWRWNPPWRCPWRSRPRRWIHMDGVGDKVPMLGEMVKCLVKCLVKWLKGNGWCKWMMVWLKGKCAGKPHMSYGFHHRFSLQCVHRDGEKCGQGGMHWLGGNDVGLIWNE